MRIGIDVRYLSHGLVGGVHTYVEQVVPALIDVARDHELFLYADSKRPLELTNLPEHVTLRHLPWSGMVSSIRNDLFMSRRMAHDRLDVAHFPANYGFGPAGARTVLTVHDEINLLPISQLLADRGSVRTARTLGMMCYLHMCTRTAVRKASLILTVSAHAKGQIAHYGAIDPSRIIPIPHAPTADLRRIRDEATLEAVRRRHGLQTSFLLADGLKNPAVLLRAWALLPEELRRDRIIVFFSRRPTTLPIVGDAVAAGFAKLLIRPSREDLIALYSMADAFVFPSWIEGFGIPILEAMTCGAPVIASNRGAIPEVTGGAARLMDAEDHDALARHLVAVLSQPVEAHRLRELGFVRARRFTWRSNAECVLEGYVRAIASRA
jgi:glycosyltransferase involved in cell wall biosynthesis